jgi:hypothetical protein
MYVVRVPVEQIIPDGVAIECLFSLTQPHPVQRVEDRTGVGEQRLGLAQRDVADEDRTGLGAELIPDQAGCDIAETRWSASSDAARDSFDARCRRISAAGSFGMPSRADSARNLDGNVPDLTTVTASP